jgi:hypothetical protein
VRCHWKVPGLDQKRNSGLTYLILASISFKIVSLGTYTVIPSFLPSFKSIVEVIFLNVVEYHFRFPLDVTVSKRHPFHLIFNLGNKVKSQGAKSSEQGGWGTITMLLLVTNSVVLRDMHMGVLL